MQNLESLLSKIETLPFGGRVSDMEQLYLHLQHLLFFFEARAEAENDVSQKLLACAWELRDKMSKHKEEQWEWLFVYTRDRVKRICAKFYPEQEIKVLIVEEELSAA